MFERIERIEQNYSPKEKFPLREYAFATLVFNALLLGVATRKPRRGTRESLSAEMRDLLLLGGATHKLARIITKDEITSFIRAPFTRYQEPLGYGEVSETPRRSGGLQVVGEVLSCSYCMSAWVGLGLFLGFSAFPRQTRSLAAFFSSLSISDLLSVVYEERRTRVNVLTLREEKLDREDKKAS